MSVAFCRYLLEHNRLDPLAFLESIDQLRAGTPTLPRLIWDHKLLEGSAMLAAFSHQAAHRISFELSCKTLGFWNQSLEDTLGQILAAGHQSIFHILVERNLMTCSELIGAMDEFLAEHAQAATRGEAA